MQKFTTEEFLPGMSIRLMFFIFWLLFFLPSASGPISYLPQRERRFFNVFSKFLQNKLPRNFYNQIPPIDVSRKPKASNLKFILKGCILPTVDLFIWLPYFPTEDLLPGGRSDRCSLFLVLYSLFILVEVVEVVEGV